MHWSWSGRFFDRLSQLKQICPEEEERETYFEKLGNTFSGKSYDQVISLLKQHSYDPSELCYIKYLVLMKNVMDAHSEVSVIENKPMNVNARLVALSTAAEQAVPAVRFIDSLLSKGKEFQGDAIALENLEHLAYMGPKIAAINDTNDLEKFFQEESKANPRVEEFSILYDVLLNKPPNATWRAGRSGPWWSAQYTYWFDHWTEDALLEIGEHDRMQFSESRTVSHEMKALQAEFGVDPFIKDTGGAGRTYLPGLFMLAWACQDI